MGEATCRATAGKSARANRRKQQETAQDFGSITCLGQLVRC